MHHIAVTLDNPPILNPFVESRAMLKQLEVFGGEMPHKLLETVESRLEADAKDATLLASDNTDQGASRDYLGEMALVAQLMITGGEKKEEERLTRQDRLLILEALIKAAKSAFVKWRLSLRKILVSHKNKHVCVRWLIAWHSSLKTH